MAKIARWIAWGVLATVAFVTVSPLGLRPDFGHMNIERFGAFVVLGLLFSVAYPRHLAWVAIALLGSAFMLEALQFVVPDRDPSIGNAVLKAVGGILGIGLGATLTVVGRHLRRETR